MKQKLLFLKTMAVCVMLLMGVSAKAVTNNVELLSNGTFTTNVTPAASVLVGSTGGLWYVGDNSKANWNTVSGFYADAATGSVVTTNANASPAIYDNFLGQITSDATINTGRYRFSINASGDQPFYVKISSTGALGTELTYVLKNASSASIVKQSSADYSGYSLKVTPTGTSTTYYADLDLQNGTPSAIRVFIVFPKVGSVTVDDISLKRTADIPSVTTFFVRPTGNTTAWTNTAGVDADQIVTTTALSSLSATNTYYFAAGNYTLSAIVSLTTGKWYGGFSGNESSIDLNARATNDKDGNGIVEPWEFTNEASITTSLANASYSGTAGTPRLMSLTGAEVNGLTFQDYYYNQASGNGAFILGSVTSSPTDAMNIVSNAGTMKYCTIRKIKTNVGNGIIMMTNSASVVDKCLIEDCRVVAGNGGAIYMNRHGGIVSNSILRNNIASGHGGAIYSGNIATASGYTGTAQTAYSAIVSNCAVYNNTGGTTTNTGGGAIRGEATSTSTKGIEIINCTVVNNTTSTAGTSSIELISSGVLANSIVLSDTKSEIRPNSTTNYVASTIYGANGGSALYPATNNVSGVADLTFTALNFKTPTTFQGAVGNSTSDVAGWTSNKQNEIKTANYSITNSTSSAVTTTSATLPSSYLASGGAGGSISITASVPTTDITGLTRTGNITLGAYQATHSVAAGETQTISQPTTLASLTVAAGGKLSINNGVAVNIGSLTLESDANGTATLIDSYNTPTVTATVKQYVTAGRNWYISAPVSNALYSQVSGGDSVVTYNEALKKWEKVTANNLIAGKGYIRTAVSGHGTTGTVDFNGLVNSGNIPVTLSRTESGSSRGFNLVGNPYPSYLDWSSVIGDGSNAGIGTSFWYRTKNTDGVYVFTTHNGTSGETIGGTTANTTITGSIPPMQAFWVRVNENVEKTTHNTTLTFKNTMRAHRDDSGNKLKAPRMNERKRLRLQLANGNSVDETLVYFDTNALNTFDSYDSPKMFNNSSVMPDIYTKSGADRLVMNGLNEVSDNMELPIGFNLNNAATLTIKALEKSNFDADTKIYLFDKADNVQTELLPETAYSFTTTSATINNESRFSLIFRTSNVATANNATTKINAQVYVNAANQISIVAPEKCNYSIYNAMGQLIENGKTTAQLHTVNCKLQTGVYVVKVNNVTERVIIK